jgi:hypothetical protein
MARYVQVPHNQFLTARKMKCHREVFGRASQTAATSVCDRQGPLGTAGRIEPQDMEDAALVQLDAILVHVLLAQSRPPKELV